MTVKECTKKELIYIIDKLTRLDKFRLNTLLNEVEYNRIKVKLAEAERFNQIADNCQEQYIEILKKYEGMRIVDIPIKELKEAEKLLKNAEAANKKADKLMKEVNDYGKSNKG